MLRIFKKKAESVKEHVPGAKTDFSDAVQKLDQIPIPNSFIDPLTFQPVVDPVITPYGNVYSRWPLELRLSRNAFDPVTHQPLSKGQLRQPPAEIMAILGQLDSLRTLTKNAILEAKDIESVDSLLNGYRLALIRLDDAMGVALKAEETTDTIKHIKDNLKIDIKNVEHKRFWEDKGKARRHIPQHVENMMSVANLRYDSVQDFLDEVNAQRHLSFSSRFFKACFRDETTKMLYNQQDEDLQTFVVKSNG